MNIKQHKKLTKRLARQAKLNDYAAIEAYRIAKGLEDAAVTRAIRSHQDKPC